MKRAEAEKLIGKRVEGSISNWGRYVGTLVKITNDKPFRAWIKVEEILELPTPYLTAKPKKKKPHLRITYPIEEGKIIEVSEYLLKPYNKPKRDYMSSLKEAIKNDLAKYKKEYESIKNAIKKYGEENPSFMEYLKFQLKLRERWIEIIKIWIDYYSLDFDV